MFIFMPTPQQTERIEQIRTLPIPLELLAKVKVAAGMALDGHTIMGPNSTIPTLWTSTQAEVKGHRGKWWNVHHEPKGEIGTILARIPQEVVAKARIVHLRLLAENTRPILAITDEGGFVRLQWWRPDYKNPSSLHIAVPRHPGLESTKVQVASWHTRCFAALLQLSSALADTATHAPVELDDHDFLIPESMSPRVAYLETLFNPEDPTNVNEATARGLVHHALASVYRTAVEATGDVGMIAASHLMHGCEPTTVIRFTNLDELLAMIRNHEAHQEKHPTEVPAPERTAASVAEDLEAIVRCYDHAARTTRRLLLAPKEWDMFRVAPGVTVFTGPRNVAPEEGADWVGHVGGVDIFVKPLPVPDRRGERL